MVHGFSSNLLWYSFISYYYSTANNADLLTNPKYSLLAYKNLLLSSYIYNFSANLQQAIAPFISHSLTIFYFAYMHNA